MSKVLREGIVSIYDILMGCRTLIRQEVPVGESTDHYIAFAEHVLDRYFFDLEQGERTLADKIGDAFELDQALAQEISDFVERDLLPRIQRTFKVVYPNRHYTYTINAEQGFIRIVESQWPGTRIVSPLEVPDDSDAWIPERLRR